MIIGEGVLFAPQLFFCVYVLIVLLCVLFFCFERMLGLVFKKVSDGRSFYGICESPSQSTCETTPPSLMHDIAPLTPLTYEDVVLKHLEDELIKPLSPDIFMIASTNRTWLEEMKSTMDLR